MSAASRCPTSGWTVCARDRQVGQDHPDPARIRRYRRPGARRLARAKAWATSSSPYPRGRRHRPCAALLRGRRRHPCRGLGRSDARRRDGRDRADAGRSRQPGAARRSPRKKVPSGGDKEAKAQLDADRAGARRAARRPARARVAESRPRTARSSRQLQLLTQAGALCLQCRRRRAPATGNASSEQVAEHAAKARAPRSVVISAAIEAEVAQLDRRRARRREYPRRRSGWTRPASTASSAPATRCSDLDHLLHRRTEGSARLDRSRAAPRRRRRPASSTPISRTASSAPRPSPMTTLSPAAASRAPRMPARCALEGKEYVVQDGDVMHFRFNV